jgi:Putative transposase DNA-binding domain
MIDGTEFGVITTKVIESIKSINKNQYLKKLQESIKLLVFQKYNPTISDFKSKENKNLLRQFVVSVDDLGNITQDEFSNLLNFELITQCKSIAKAIQILQNTLPSEQEILTETITKLSDLELKTTEIWLKMFDKAQNSLATLNHRNIIESFVLSFFFEFDGEIRDLENILLPDINLNLNSIAQSTKDWLSDVIEYPENLEYVQELYKLDWSKEKSSQDYGKVLQLLLAENKNKKDMDELLKAFKRDFDNSFLRHPKAAPSFPQFNDRQVYWNPDDRISLLLKENHNQFDNLRFFDYLLSRCLRIIQQSEVFKVYSFLAPFDIDKDTYESLAHTWLQDIISHNIPTLNLDEISAKTNLQVLSKTKKLSLKKRSINKITFKYSDGKINNRLRPIFTNKYTSVEQTVRSWLELHYKTLSRTNVELGLLYSLIQQKLLVKTDIDKWLKMLVDDPKLTRHTFNRQLALTNEIPNLQIENSEVISEIQSKLTGLENHLLLNQDFTTAPFQIFDKIAYNHYRNLTQIVLESLYVESKQIRTQKSIITKLLGESISTLPIKIDRMTATKPNGKSTLIFPINESNQKLEKNASILIYSIKPNSTGNDVVPFYDLQKALKKLNSIEGDLYCGFLNGSNDNTADKKTTQWEVDGVSKQYTKYLDRVLFNEDRTKSIIDKYRPAQTEDVGATNPSGYPKLYYFVVPKNHSNLIIPVETSNYYLNKYTPYGKIGIYFDLHKKLLNPDLEYITKQIIEKDILALRCTLRLNSQISSIEADLITKQTLKVNKEGVSIVPFVTAKFHMQFQNPRKSIIINTENPLPDYILSIDLGEKLLACATLSKTDWDNKVLERIFTTYLPLQKKSFENLEESEINPKLDNSYNNYLAAKNRYEQSQKVYGIRMSKLANRRDNLADSYALHIAVQIAKIAHQYNAQVVFENLQPGFGNKNTIKIYNLIKTQVIKLVGEGTQNNQQNGAIAHPYKVEEVIAAGTSQMCSKCDYLPRFTTENTSYIDIVDTWAENGIISYNYQGNDLLSIKNTDGPKLTVISKIIRVGHDLETIVYPTKSNGKIVFNPLKKLVHRYLFTELGNKRKSGNLEAFHKIMRKTLLYTRLDQETFSCPNCGYKENADYQASYNIGKKWFKRKLDDVK